jgi:plastocyanin
MRRLATACVLASLTLVAGCGSDGSDDSAADGSGSAAALTSSAPAATSSAAAATSSSAAATSSSAAATSSSPTVLTGTVGTESDPDAFVITLTDSSGQKVTTLPAGDYTIQVHDLSAQHNFHLTGGSVDEKTSVPEVVDTTFDVTLAAGDYTFKCDPHPPMKGTFTVT